MPLEHVEPHHRPPRHRVSERAACPFCPGNEHDTPAESYAIREAGTDADRLGWSLRVVPNKFPAVVSAGGAFGIHEVVIPCAEHESNPTRLSDGQLAALFIAIRERLRAYSTDERLAYAQAFQNVGAEAGASLDHVHAQLLATPFVPEVIEQELGGSKRYFDKARVCVFCQLAEDACRVLANDQFIAFCPPAPRFAFETWIVPAVHSSDFLTISERETNALVSLLKRLLAAIDRVLHEPAYNVILHTAPFRTGSLPHYHWHLEIIPRTARAAGFEWGAGVFINTVLPEQAARELLDAIGLSACDNEPEA